MRSAKALTPGSAALLATVRLTSTSFMPSSAACSRNLRSARSSWVDAEADAPFREAEAALAPPLPADAVADGLLVPDVAEDCAWSADAEKRNNAAMVAATGVRVMVSSETNRSMA